MTTSLRQEESLYVFTCRGVDDTLEYIFAPQRGLLKGLCIRDNGREVVNPFSLRVTMAPEVTEFDEAERARQAADETVDLSKMGEGEITASATARFLGAKQLGAALVADYEFTDPAVGTATMRFTVKAVGKSLEVGMVADKPVFNSVTVAIKGEAIPSEYEIGGPSCRIADGYFAASFPDVWQSDASQLRADGAVYNTMTDGTRMTLRETFYLTVSDAYPETLANSPWPASPYLEEFENRVVLDMFEGTFADHLALLEELNGYGVDSLLIILHYWQNKGFDRSNPDMMPANDGLGGDAGLRELSVGAHKLGHRFCLHENYYDISNAYASQYEGFLALNPDGTPLPRAGGNMLFVKPSRHMELAEPRAAEATEAYDLNLTFHDVMPHWKVDYDANDVDPGILRLSALEQKRYFQAMRDMRDGPVVTEMLASSLAGLWDGGCNAYMNNMLDRKLLPLASLLKVHNKQANHGVGYYERWLPWGFKPGWSSYKMTDRELDRYRAMEVGFGRMGFIGRQLNSNTPHVHAIVREYHLLRAFGEGYINQKIRKLEYQTADGQWISPVEAAETGQWQRLRATYDGDQLVWVNYTDEPWKIDGLDLPAWGSATRGPRCTAGTELRDGQISDYAEYEDVIYADARSHTWTPVENQPPIIPRLGEWKDLGNGAFEMEVVWDADRTLPYDYRSFWMFRDAGSTVSRPVFHSLDQPGEIVTSTWQADHSYSDKRRLSIPTKDARTGGPNKTDKYDIVVGMTHPTGATPRPELVHRLNQMRIATMEVEREGDKIVSINISEAEQAPPPGEDPIPYEEDLNIAQKVLDFGEVATNGAVVVRKVPEGRELVPVPQGEPMRVGLAGPVKEVVAYVEGGDNPVALETTVDGDKTYFELPVGVNRAMAKE
ncbi:MAG: DUF5696 domain-containing protein [Verrucomicrobiota bacterium JB024]|nr:DUF5696 domain-containing protein [Verrucomicrobiota bacterium JB024]